jgi:alcohol dehydrogenase class IV
MANRIILNETSYHGSGSRSEIAAEVKRRGFKKAFFVTDKDLIKFGVAGKIEKVLNEADIPYEIFTDLKANPNKLVQDKKLLNLKQTKLIKKPLVVCGVYEYSNRIINHSNR